VITLVPHLETLPLEQQSIWSLLGPTAGLGLVLYGGTAIALRLGHRDIAALIGDGRDLANALGGARALYGASFQPSESLKALTYFEGGDLHQLSRQDRLTLVDAVKAVKIIPGVEIIDNSLSIGVTA